MALDKNFRPVLRFMVVSDIHYKDERTVERERFETAIRKAYEISRSSETYKRLDALYIDGDFADNGSDIQMLAIKETIDNFVNRDETVVRLTMASHEYSQKNGGEDAAKERFARIFNLPYDTHEVINGFHFIGVTTTQGCRFKEHQQEFAREELKKAAADDPKKPIFFFQHPHISDTVYGSINWGEDELTAILMNYPQIINFSGHSHAPINDPRSIHQKYFTSLGTGTLSYFELDEFDKIYGTLPPDKEKAAQMLIVEADADNRVRVYPYDVLTENFFGQTWKIDEPSNPESFIYTDARYKTLETPEFSDGAVFCAKDITENGVKITFTQAEPDKDSDYVNGYEIIIRKNDGTIAKQLSVWSRYYFYDMPSEIEQVVDELDADTEYTVEIYANGFFKNRSKKALKGSFRTL